MEDLKNLERPNREQREAVNPPEVFQTPEPVSEAERREVRDALRKAKEVPSAASTPSAVPAPRIASGDPVSALVPEVQRVLAEGLYETYAHLPPSLQQKFKVEGERTATAVVQLLTEVRVRAARIIALIRRWLSLIPGVNRYYLEQEAKLKADAVLALKNRTP